MKNILVSLVIVLVSFSTESDKIITKNGSITFEASVPAFEEVKAQNNAVTCIVNTTNGEIAALALMRGFRFKIALMEEHFNENYVESSKYPKATFKGKIEDFDLNKITSNAKDYTINGKLTIHGKTKDISIKSKIKKVNKNINLVSDFKVNADDFDIEIPSVVSKKVSKNVAVSFNFDLN